MLPVLTSTLMREIDRQAIEEVGIPSLVLMENAGRGIASRITSRHQDIKHPVAAVFCGKGNNGGDGMVIARNLASSGWKVTVVLLFPLTDLSPDCLHQYTVLTRLTELDSDLEVSVIQIGDSSKIWELPPADVTIDAILGTGSAGRELSPLIFSAVEWMNANPFTTYSVDLPTGLNPDNGMAANAVVRAERTFALGAVKQGFYVNDGPVCTGTIEVVDIGIPARLLNQSRVSLNSKEDVSGFFPVRNRTIHKYEAGHVLVIGGSQGMHGAPVLAAKSAYSTGAGMVTLVTSRTAYPAVASGLTDALVFPVDWSPGCMETATLADRLEKTDCLVIGPGLGRADETVQFVQNLLTETELPVVLDADGLFAVAGQEEIWKKIKAPVILTPHLGEFCRLTGLTPDEVAENPVDAVRNFSMKIEQVVVLKGPHIMIASPSGLVIVNPTGNTGLATAGTGDVLTGIIAGLIAQGSYLEDAAADGVFLHGLAADLAVKETTEYGLTASGLIPSIPAAIREILNV